MGAVTLRLVAGLFSLLLASPLMAQTATTASMSGRITDAQGSVVPGATVTLTDRATTQARTGVSDPQGRYAFFTLPPGVYDLSATLEGFKTATVTGIVVEATRPVVQDVGLELGGLAEQVTVSATSETLVIKRDSSVGNTIERERLMLLPNLTRDAANLLALQPGATSTGFVTGARTDQATYSVDGIDVSDNVIGTTFRTAVPTPAESIEEFRMTVANPNVSFGRSSGAQVSFVTKRGTNSFHGSVYGYTQDENWNATSWDTNRLGLPKPPLEDNRFGGSLGGPIVKGKTFFFGLYEGRRDRGSSSVTRLVPTASLKQGLLQFRDAGGGVQTINPRTFDPRGLGANPLILQMLSLYPEPNDFTAGDGLNTAGFTFDYATPTDDNQGIFRLDHSFSSDWRLDASMNVADRKRRDQSQVDIVNRLAVRPFPTKGTAVSVGLVGVLSSTLTNEFRVGYVKDDRAVGAIDPAPQVPGLNIAVDLAGTFLGEPVDVGTQNARRQAFPLETYQVINNLTWLKGSHTLQGGFNLRFMHEEDFRNDKVIGSISTPVAQVSALQFSPIPASQRPSFIAAADVQRYNQLYAALLGQVDSSAYMATRDGNLQPNPIGTGLITESDLSAYEFYAADTWQVSPTFTLNYGLTYNWQTPPTEKEGRQTLLTFRDTGDLVDPKRYLADKRAAAERGEIYNPALAYIPIRESGRSHAFDVDWTNVSPRISAAWTPSFTSGWTNRLFGDGKSVIRGGYSLLYDRSTTVQTITIPTLGVGFAQTLSANSPRNAAGQPFRVGVDGQIPVPVNTAAQSPIVPNLGFGETLSFVVDPNITVPRSHTASLTLQRELRGNLVLELGYIGRYGRNLYQSLNLNQVPYMFRDNISGQTFAQAFDALAAQLRANPGGAAGVTPQPWFENLLPGLGPSGSRTRALASIGTADIINGNLSNLFLFVMDQVAARSFDNLQVLELFMRTSIGRSNYNGFFTTVRKRFSNGLAFDANYTWSKSLDQVGAVQNSASLLPNSFDPDSDYGPSFDDVTHIFNSNWVYDLPLGSGRWWGGWYTAGIFRAQGGFPLTLVQGTQVFGGSALLGFNSGALPTGDLPDASVNDGVSGSGGIGTNSDRARNGTGLNLFQDPEGVYNGVRRLRLSEDTQTGRGPIRGLGFWQLDLSLGKSTRIAGDTRLTISVDAINVLNHVNFADPTTLVASTTSLQQQTNFGVITNQRINTVQNILPRRVQLGVRFDF